MCRNEGNVLEWRTVFRDVSHDSKNLLVDIAIVAHLRLTDAFDFAFLEGLRCGGGRLALLHTDSRSCALELDRFTRFISAVLLGRPPGSLTFPSVGRTKPILEPRRLNVDADLTRLLKRLAATAYHIEVDEIDDVNDLLGFPTRNLGQCL